MVILNLGYSQKILTDDNRTLLMNLGQFKFNNSINLTSNLAKNVQGNTSVDIIRGHKINKLYTQGDTVFFSYLPFPENSTAASTYNKKEFLMKADVFNQLTDTLKIYKKYKGTTVGVYTVPFRLRMDKDGKNFDYESSLSLTSNIIVGLGRSDRPNSWIDFSLGLGLTGANLDSLNSNVIENRTAMAFTVNGGALFKPNRYANIGVFLGFDFLGRKDRPVNWIYNKTPWIGLGINISFNELTAGRVEDTTN